MTSPVSIGSFAALCGLSVSTLRFYDRQNVLKPAQVHPESGYRLYALAQVEDGRRLTRLRRLGLPLSELRRAVLQPDELPAVLHTHGQRLAQQRAVLDARWADLQALLHPQEAQMYDVVTKTEPAQSLLQIRAQAPLDGVSGAVVDAFRELNAALAEGSVTSSGSSFFACYGMGEQDLYDLRMAYPIPESARPRLSGRLELGRAPERQVAATLHAGPYSGLGGAYDAVTRWVAEQGLSTTGNTAEVYLLDYTRTDDEEALRTEVQLELSPNA